MPSSDANEQGFMLKITHAIAKWTHNRQFLQDLKASAIRAAKVTLISAAITACQCIFLQSDERIIIIAITPFDFSERCNVKLSNTQR
jgi:hypothetical protein